MSDVSDMESDARARVAGAEPGEPTFGVAAAFDNVPCGLVTTLPDGTILRQNEYLRRWLRIPDPTECETVRIADLITPAHAAQFTETVLPRLIQRGSVRQIALDLRGPDGPTPAFLSAAVRADGDGTIQRLDFALFDMADRVRHERELLQRRRKIEQLAAIEQASPDAIMTLGRDFVIQTWNSAATRLFGHSDEDAIGRRFDELLVPEDQRESQLEFVRAVQAGQPSMYETSRLHRDGQAIAVEVHAAPMHDSTGAIIGSTHILRDAEPRRKAQEHVRTIMDELRHRTKNVLSIVQVVARQTAQTSTNQEFIDKFSSRLRSLAASQDMLVKSQWRGVKLDDLIRAQLHHLELSGQSSFVTRGPDLTIRAKPAEALGMAIYELATNAAKYGALSWREGSVEVSWALSQDEPHLFALHWTERHGPPVKEPERSGFGSVVTGRLIESATRGTVTAEFAPTGLVWSLVAPAEALVEEAE